MSAIAPCFGCLALELGGDSEPSGLLPSPLPGLDDPEGDRLPTSLPPVTDAHVHLFPQPMFAALWRWFEAHAWPIRYRLDSPGVLDFLFTRGVERAVGLMYSHRPGMARSLNAFMAALAADEPRLVPLATVLPGEPDAGTILDEAFAAGLRGVKLHCHVQCFAPDDPRMIPIYEACVRHDRPLVIHAGREPKSPAYDCDPHEICSAQRTENVLREWPTLRLCVPHLGADEFEAYERLLGRYDTLWLDTTMMLADYFDVPRQIHLLRSRPGRILYGSDFPNLPYAWDRELARLTQAKLPEDELAVLLSGAATGLFGAAS